MRLLAPALACLIACLAAGAASAAESPLQQAREEAGEPAPTPATWPLPGGTLRVTPSDLLGSGVARITFTVRLDRPVPGGALAVELPEALTRVNPSGLRATRPPRPARGDGIERDGRTVVLPFRGGEREYAFSLEAVALRVGRYELPLRWRGRPGERLRRAGAAELTVFAPARESAPEPGSGWRSTGARSPVNASADGGRLQAETFVALDPSDPARAIVAANGSSDVEFFLQTGAGIERRALPPLSDVPGTETPEPVGSTCDPVLAGDPNGSLWYGAVNQCSVDDRDEAPPAPTRIVLSRIDPAGIQPALAVGLPTRPGSTGQDKPMIAFDPARRRILATWVEFAGPSTYVVLAWCDVDAVDCEDADAWQGPIPVTATAGNYVYPDVAAGPNGQIYVVWWDYSVEENAVRGAVCESPCPNPAPGAPGFSSPSTIARLDFTNGVPLPFACPILVAPGGRVGAVPSVEVDRTSGRVYVSWGDLRPQSGSTRCEYVDGRGTPQLPTHRTWDAYAASRVGGLPGAAAPSSAVGTPLVVDGDEGVHASSDDFLPWLTVDQATGEAWAALYSTGHDPERATAHFVSASLRAVEGGHLVGPANRVSSAPSGFGSAPCCDFGNDFGDYEGIDAAQGQVVPAWTDNSAGVPESYVFRGPLATVGFDLQVVGFSELAGSDGDALAEPGERVALTVRVRNTGTRTAAGAGDASLEGVVGVAGPGLSASPARVSFPPLGPGGSALGSAPIEVAVAPGYDCARPGAVTLTLRATEGTETVAVPLAVSCPAIAPPPPPARAPFVAGLVDLEIPSGQRLRTVRSRGLRVQVLCASRCRVGLRGSIDARTARALRTRLRTLARSTVTAPGGRVVTIRLRPSPGARRALGRSRRRTLRTSIQASVAGVSAGETATLTRRTTLVR